MRTKIATVLKRKQVIFVVLCLGLSVAASLAVTKSSSVASRLLDLASVEPAFHEEPIYATYQFNMLKHPTGLWLAKPMNGGVNNFHLFIADSGNHIIRQFRNAYGDLLTVAGNQGQPGYVDGYAGLLDYPTGLAGESTTWMECEGPYRSDCTFWDYQKLYISDSANSSIRKICVGSIGDPENQDPQCDGQLWTVAGTNSSGFVDGSNSSARFASLGGLSKIGGTYYVADATNHAIRTWNGSSVTTFAGDGSWGFTNGYRTSARFFIPSKVTMDNSGTLYVADTENHAIRRIYPSGYVSTCAGLGQPGHADGSGTNACFYRPTSVVFHPADSMIYVADSHNNSIRRIDSAGNVTTYAGSSEGGYVDGPLLQARFDGPTDLVIYANTMYVSDSRNNCIRRIDMVNGQVSTFIR